MQDNDPQDVSVSVAAGIPDAIAPQPSTPPPVPAVEIGGPSGPEPTRYGDWERNGRCIDF
jgi:hypothetical protein